jgi:uncharacterized protein (DUF302 family)
MLRILFTLFFLFVGACTSEEKATEYYSRETGKKSYQDVMAELELAITERNFRITGHNKIGSVIRERDGIDFPDYDSLQFCNLTEARVMLEMSPETVAWMPCTVSLRLENGKVVVTTHLLPIHNKDPRLNQFAETMNQRLREIVNFAVAD